MKRRILSLMLAALLLLPAAVSLAATVPVTITSDDIRGNVGDTVTATLNIVVEAPKVGQTMDSLQFVLEYDSAALEYIGIQEVSSDRINILGAQYICNVTTKAGAVAFTASATSGAAGSGLLMHVKFRILSAMSTMLVLKKVSYSFVTSSSGSQRGYTGGTINLGRITGQSVPTTAAPSASYAPNTQSPYYYATAVPTDAPRFPVTEVTLAPGASPTAEPVQGDSDVLAYIVFGLFIVVAIMICVVLTLMIVRRSRNKAEAEFLADDEEEGYDGDEQYNDRYGSRYDDRYEEEEDDRAYRRGYSEPKEKPKKKKKKYVEYDEEDEPPIEIVRTSKGTGKSSGKSSTKDYGNTTTKKSTKKREY